MVVCELICEPFTTMSICDDGPYIRMAVNFARTGHIVYNGWATAMIVAQIYLAQPFIKLFGDSYTSVRMTTLAVAAVTAFVFHRLLVRAGISERNATLGTLTLVLSPLYLMLAATFMSDIYGLLAIVLCLYGCLRALQSRGDGAATGWICFAVVACALLGTSRQIAWLGDLVMVPCTLCLLRSRRRVLLVGAAITAVAFLFILACMHWFGQQPYSIPVPLIVRPFPRRIAARQLSYILLEIPLMVLPVIAVFAPRIFRSPAYLRYLSLTALVVYVGFAVQMRNSPDPIIHLEPTAGISGSWVTIFGVFTGLAHPPVFLHAKASILLTVVSLGGLLGVVAVVVQARRAVLPPHTRDGLSWRQLGTVLVPFSILYLVFLIAAAGTMHAIYDRYILGLLGPAMIALIRLYRDRVRPNLPLACVLLIIVMAGFGVTFTHNTFALERARVELANELHAQGVPFTAIDGAWDYNLDTELDHSDHINHSQIKVPAGAYVLPPSPPPGYCRAPDNERTPHIHAIYGISFSPHTCYGRAAFAPVQYRSWPLGTPIDLYVVRYAPPGR